mgnify:CR=1 FL=1
MIPLINEFNEFPRDDVQLLAWLDRTRGELRSCQVTIGHIEQEIWQRMEARGAKGIPDDTFVCEDATRNTYNQELLMPLKEVLIASELANCFIPRHEETYVVPDKWDIVQVRVAAKRSGAEALAIVDKARAPGARQLKFERKKGR